MITIEERARICGDLCLSCIDCGEVEQGCMDCERRGRYIGYKRGATEQDRIARQEERERCIKIIEEKVCGWCLVDDDDCYKTSCMARELRKAIEEGGEV